MDLESRSLEHLKHRLPEYLQSLGLAPRFKSDYKLTCRCPLHPDRHPSFTAARAETGWLWYCHPCAKGGSIIDLHAALHGLDAAQAIRELGQRFADPFQNSDGASISNHQWTRINTNVEAQEANPSCAFVSIRGFKKKPDGASEPKPTPWPLLRKGTEAELAAVAALRGLPLQTMWAAQTLKFLRFTRHKDYMPCYALTDGDGHFLQLRRMDGQPFCFGGRSIKAWNWPGCRQTPLGARYLLHDPQQPVLIAEGAVSVLEVLSLLDLTHVTQDSWRWGFMAMTGASAKIPEDLLPKLQGRQIRIIGDRDEAGQRAAQLWADQCRLVHCEVDVVELTDLPELDHQPKADLGDLLRLPDSPRKTNILNHLVS